MERKEGKKRGRIILGCTNKKIRWKVGRR